MAGLVWTERVTQTTGSICGTMPMRPHLLLQGPGLGTLRAAGSQAWPERPASSHSWWSEGCAVRLPWALLSPSWLVRGARVALLLLAWWRLPGGRQPPVDEREPAQDEEDSSPPQDLLALSIQHVAQEG